MGRDAPLGSKCIELILLFGKRNLINLFDNSVVSVIIIIRIIKKKKGNEKDPLCVSKAMSKI